MGRLKTFLAATAAGLAFAGLGSAASAQSLMNVRVSQSGETPVSKDLLLPISKSSVVELNTPAADVIIANPEIADVIVRTPQRIIFRGVGVGETNAFFFDAHGNQLLDLQIRVEQDLNGLEDLFKRYIPDGRVKAEAVNGRIVLTGRVMSRSEAETAVTLAENFIVSSDATSSAEGASPIINLIMVEGKEQVLLKVRIVEMQRTLTKQLGINVTNTQTFGDFAAPVQRQVWEQAPAVATITDPITGALSFQNVPGVAAVDANGNPIFETVTEGFFPGQTTSSSSNAFSVAGRALGGLSLSAALSNFVGPRGAEVLQSSIGANLNALERVGLIRTLAEPNLTAITGESAKFLAGGEFPVPVGSDDEGNVRLEFKQFGVGLGFTPVVLSEGRISLRISTEVSELSNEGAFAPESVAGTDGQGNVISVQSINVPALTVRRVESTVELPSGGSMVIAGLIQEKTKQALDGVPGVKDVPVLGALFRSRDFQNSETELVVIVTPYLVDPTDPRKLRTPDEGYGTTTDLATIFLGKLNDLYAVPGADTAGKSFDAPVGFIVE